MLSNHKENHEVKKRNVSPEVRNILDNMYAVLSQVANQRANFMRDLNQPFQSRSNFMQQEPLAAQQQQPEKMLLTPKQAEGVAQIQKLANQAERICQQINTLNIVYELGLKPTHFIELPDLLMKLDAMLYESKIAARQQGVKAEALPKAKHCTLTY